MLARQRSDKNQHRTSSVADIVTCGFTVGADGALAARCLIGRHIGIWCEWVGGGVKGEAARVVKVVGVHHSLLHTRQTIHR